MSVIGEAAVVGRVRIALDDNSRLDDGEGELLAREYAQMCTKANARLAMCVQYLDSGSKAEAIQLAEQPPSLLDLCAVLDFGERGQWVELCADRQWESSPPIDAEAINALNDAYASSELLDPVLTRYRLAVRKKNTAECIRLLKQLLRLDPENTGWASDLASFEHQRVREIEEEFRVAKGKGDADALASLIVETQQYSSLSADAGLIVNIRHELRQIHEYEALQKGREIVNAISAAYAALDVDSAGSAIDDYERLLTGGYFQPTAEIEREYIEAREWHEIERKKAEKEVLFSVLVEQLTQAVEEDDAVTAEETLNRLGRFEKALPQNLENRALAVIENYRVAKERRYRRRILIALVIVVLLVGGAFVALSHRRYRTRKAELLQAMSEAFAREDLSSVLSIRDQAEENDALVFRSREFQSWVGREQELRDALKKRKSDFLGYIAQLERAQADGFENDERTYIEDLLERAKSSALENTDQENYASIHADWLVFRQATRRAADTAMRSSLEAIADRIASVDLTMNDRPATLRELDQINVMFLEVPQSPDVSPGLIEELDGLQARCERTRANVGEYEEQITAISEINTLIDYLREIEVLVKAFPQSDLTHTLAPVHRRSPYILGFAQEEHAKDVEDPYWAPLRAELELREKRCAQHYDRVRESLKKLTADPIMSDLYYCQSKGKTKGGWVATYFLGAPAEKRHDRYNALLYVGEVFVADDTRARSIFEYSPIGKIDMRTPPARMAHCEVIDVMVSNMRVTSPRQSHRVLVDSMISLAKTRSISPLLTVQIMGTLVDQLTILTGETLPQGWADLRSDFRGIDSELDWLCVGNPAVIQANERSREVLDEHFARGGLPDCYLAEDEIRNTALARSVEFVGFVGLDGESVRLLPGKAPKEIWVLRDLGEADVPQVVIAAEAMDEEWVKYAGFEPGEPLFCHAGDTSTRSILKDIKTRFHLKGKEDLSFPVSWPTNLRW